MTETTNASSVTGRPGDALRASRIVPIHPNVIIALIPGATPLLDGENITLDRAMRLSFETGASVRFWLNVQEAFDNKTSL